MRTDSLVKEVYQVAWDCLSEPTCEGRDMVVGLAWDGVRWVPCLHQSGALDTAEVFAIQAYDFGLDPSEEWHNWSFAEFWEYVTHMGWHKELQQWLDEKGFLSSEPMEEGADA